MSVALDAIVIPHRRIQLVNTANAVIVNTALVVVVNTANITIVNTANVNVVNVPSITIVNTANVVVVNTANITIVNTANVNVVNTANVNVVNFVAPYTLANVVNGTYAIANAPMFSSNLTPTSYPTLVAFNISISTTALVSLVIYNSVQTATAVSYLNAGSYIYPNVVYSDTVLLNTGDSINFMLNTTATIVYLTVVAYPP